MSRFTHKDYKIEEMDQAEQTGSVDHRIIARRIDATPLPRSDGLQLPLASVSYYVGDRKLGVPPEMFSEARIEIHRQQAWACMKELFRIHKQSARRERQEAKYEIHLQD